jgi:hypothetical protein
MLIHGKATVYKRWQAVVHEYSKKSTYVQADMCTKFMGMCCPKKTNPREFLEGLRVRREELAQVGVMIEEKDYFSVIISSLLSDSPISYQISWLPPSSAPRSP